jgi:triacylglycerol lipase
LSKGNKKTLLLVLAFLIPLFLINISRAIDVESSTDNSQNPILFVHGWTGEASNWNSMKGRFTNDGWSSELLYAYTFNDNYNYSADGNIQNAEQISNWVDDILNATGAEKVDIVSHSMGGISSRYYVKFLDGLNKVDDYVSMGSPHHGVQGGAEVFLSTCAFLYNLNNGDETPGGILEDTTGLRVDPIGGAAYNGTHTSGNIGYTSIYSNGDTICTPFRTSRLVGANNTEVNGLSHNTLLFHEDVYKLVRDALQEGISNANTIQGYYLIILLGFSSVLIICIITKQKLRKSLI